jgi:hypothetical protein
MVAAILLAMLILAAWRFPDTALGQVVARRLVGPLVRWMAAVDRRKVIFILLILAVLLCAGELIAAAGPLDMSMVLLWDVASFVDAAMATLAIASVTRAGNAAHAVRALFGGRVRLRARQRRSRPARRKSPPANDQDGPALAACA